jgi:hypothetical protein
MAKNRIYVDDTAVVVADIWEEDEETPLIPSFVTWEFARPDNSMLTVGSLPATADLDDRIVITQTIGAFPQWSVLSWDGAAWVDTGAEALSALIENEANFVIPGEAINKPGSYRGRARFKLADDTWRSHPVQFEAIDPLITEVDLLGVNGAVNHAWMKLEDLFDSELGGPWAQDETRANIDRNKLKMLLPDALYLINQGFQPVTSFDDTNFPPNHMPLLSSALLVEMIYHLMRTYVEQPLPAGANINWMDRRDYLQRWQSVLALEEKRLMERVDIFKREYTGFGSSALLVGGYASTLTRTPAGLRARYPRFVVPYRAI